MDPEEVGPRPQVLAHQVAGRQLGLLTRDQARDCGMSDRTITRQLTRGWRSVHRGVFLLPGYQASWEQTVLAACMRGGRGTVASHDTAAALLGLDGFSRRPPLHVLGRSNWQAPDVVVHRTRRLPECDLDRAGAVPITSASRTLLDLGAVVDQDVVETALECALRRGLTSIPRLKWRLEQVGGRGHAGSAALRRLLDLRDPLLRPAQSVLEVRLVQKVRRARLPQPIRQFEVRVPNGRRFLDFAFPHAMLAVEVGGRHSHTGPAAEQRDALRHNELTALGWRILYFTWNDVEHRVDYVVGCIRRELQPQLL